MSEKTKSKMSLKKVKKDKIRKPISFTKMLLLSLVGIVLAVVLVYLIYYIIHYVNYKGHEQFLATHTYEDGTVFKSLGQDSDVAGFELVAETDSLKLLTKTSTADVAIFDKRTGEITYSNPQNADSDSVANATNINFLKSQFILYYYNDDVISGYLNSYSDSVSKGNFEVEGIKDGVRYIYNISDGAATFSVPLEYRLKDDYLEVSIPSEQIEEIGGGYVYRIQLLRYMGATSYDDTGYMVVPNGSGSIINFNNQRSAVTYSQYIYDIDPLASTYTTVEPLQVARLPIFGICKENNGVLVSIEQSATNCVLTAGVSGVSSDYNFVYPSFVMRTVDDLKNFGDSTTSVQVMEENRYLTPINVRYTFLTEENKGYSGMANYYRQRLIDEGVLKESNYEGDIPFYYDVIGGAKETSHFLGVQYLNSFKMTSFDEAGLMSDQLLDAGVVNQVMNFQGWFNGGFYHDAADSVKVMSKLGGKSDLEALNRKLVENGGRLYSDVAFQKVSYADDRFPYTKVASRYYGSGYTARFGLVNPTTLRNTANLGYAENMYSSLSPRYLPRYVEGFAKDIDGIDVTGISLRDLGSYLISDKKRTCSIEREDAKNIVEGQFELLSQTGKKIMTSEANDYAFAYSTDIINAPMTDTKYEIIDEGIPLYEMILHGYVDYSSELLNYENMDNIDEVILKLIENGASPHFVFTWENSSRMKMTALNRYYSTTFDVWKEKAVSTYQKINEPLKLVMGAAMVSHEIIESDVRKVTYDNGISILINYGEEDVTVDGIKVPAVGYAVEGR